MCWTIVLLRGKWRCTKQEHYQWLYRYNAVWNTDFHWLLLHITMCPEIKYWGTNHRSLWSSMPAFFNGLLGWMVAGCLFLFEDEFGCSIGRSLVTIGTNFHFVIVKNGFTCYEHSFVRPAEPSPNWWNCWVHEIKMENPMWKIMFAMRVKNLRTIL